MSGETWSTPSGVGSGEAVPTTWFDTIADDLIVLHRGNGMATPSAIEPDASGVLDVGETNDTFLVNGSNALKFITYTNRQFGNRINLIRTTGDGTVMYAQTSPPSGSLPIYANEYGPILQWRVNGMVSVVLGSTGWHHDITDV